MSHRRLLASTFSLAALVACGADASAPEAVDARTSTSALTGGIVEVTGFGTNPGGLKMYEHAPAGLGAKAAVVVVLHGCTQGAADIATSGWNELADKYGFVVVYPEQSTTNNSERCFNWGGVYGDLTKIERGKDENESIKEMVDKSVATHSADTKRVFVAGFSAGGGEAAVMAATWPDVFAAGATIAGIPYHCNSSFAEAFTCMKPGITKTPAQWSALVKGGYAGYAGVYPRMSIWQGANDGTVAPANRTELVKQWTDVHGATQTPAASDTVNGANHAIYKDTNGNVVVETYEVPGMDHGIAVDTKNGCGAVGTYAPDKGICTAALVIKFFGLDGSPSGSSSSSSGTSGGSSAAPGTSSGATSGTSGGTSSPSPGSGGGGKPGSDDPGSAASTCAARPLSSQDRTHGGWALGVVLALGALVRVRRGRR